MKLTVALLLAAATTGCVNCGDQIGVTPTSQSVAVHTSLDVYCTASPLKQKNNQNGEQ